MPVIGFLDPRSPGTVEYLLRAFRQGLKDNGYVEGENVAIEYRWAENQIDRRHPFRRVASGGAMGGDIKRNLARLPSVPIHCVGGR
jgi:hypothetical protein